jgi:hypothetical protein
VIFFLILRRFESFSSLALDGKVCMRKVSARKEGAFWCCFFACVLDCSSAIFAVSAKQSVRTLIRLDGLRLRGGESGGRAGNMWILTHDIECDAVTLAWEKVENAVCYEIQLKVGPDGDFKTMSDKLSSTMVCLISAQII